MAGGELAYVNKLNELGFVATSVCAFRQMRTDDAGEQSGSGTSDVTPGNIKGTRERIADDVLGDLADNELVEGETTFVVELLGKD